MLSTCLIGLVIEEITEEVGTMTSENLKNSSTEYSVTQPREGVDASNSGSRASSGGLATNSESLQALKDDPEAVRLF